MCFYWIKLKRNWILPHLTQYSVLTLLTLTVWNHNVGLQADHFQDLQIYSKGFVNNKPIFDRKLTFIERVSQFSTGGGGEDDYAHASQHPYSTFWLNLLLCDRYMLISWNNIIYSTDLQYILCLQWIEVIVAFLYSLSICYLTYQYYLLIESKWLAIYYKQSRPWWDETFPCIIWASVWDFQ